MPGKIRFLASLHHPRFLPQARMYYKLEEGTSQWGHYSIQPLAGGLRVDLGQDGRTPGPDVGCGLLSAMTKVGKPFIDGGEPA